MERKQKTGKPHTEKKWLEVIISTVKNGVLKTKNQKRRGSEMQ